MQDSEPRVVRLSEGNRPSSALTLHTPLFFVPQTAFASCTNSIIVGVDMSGRQEPVLHVAETVLICKSQKYKQIPESLHRFLLSSRLRKGLPLTFALSTPGIFLTEVGENTLLIVASTKLLGDVVVDRNRLQVKVIECNEQESPYLWKVEESGGKYYPVAETTLYVSGDTEAAQLQIWSACVAIDAFFNATMPALLPPNIAGATKVIKRFLTDKGIERVEESKLPAGGQNLLVVLGIGSETENVSFRRFPISIDIVDTLIVFRATFAVNSVRVCVEEPFQGAILQLASQFNWLLDLGHYDFSYNQLHLTFQLHYPLLTLRELEDCVGSYYEGLCTAYAATVKAIASLYQQTLKEQTEVEDVFAYLRLVNEEVKGDTYFEKVDYATELELQEDTSLFNQLLGSRLLADYFLPNPYILSQSAISLYRKNAQQLSPFTVVAANFPFGRNRLYHQISDLYTKLRPGGLYPAIELLHVRDKERLVLLLGRGIHRDYLRFLKECSDILLRSAEGLDRGNDDFLVKFASFEDFFEQEEGGLSLVTAYIGNGAYFLHPLSDLIDNFTMWLYAYRSYWSTLQSDSNSIIGWTYSDSLSNSKEWEGSGSLFLCERAKYKLWDWHSSLADCFQLLLSLESLHRSGQFHLFLSKAVLRKDPETQGMTLALPCGNLVFAEFMHSFLGQQCTDCQAPEVKAFLAGGAPMPRPEKADIYSVGRVITATVGKCGGALEDLLRRTETSDPGERPELREIKEALQKHWEERDPHTAPRILANLASLTSFTPPF